MKSRILENLLLFSITRKNFSHFDELCRKYAKKIQLRPLTLNIMLIGNLQQKKPNATIATWAKYEKLRNQQSWNLVLKAFLIKNDLKKAKTHIEEMYARVMTPSSDLLLEFYTKKGNWEKLASVWFDGFKNGISNAYYFDQLCQRWIEKKASHKFDEIFYHVVDHTTTDVNVLNSLLKYYLDGREKEKFVEVEKLFKNYKVSKNLDTLEILFEWYYKVSDFEKVMNIVNSIKQKGFKASPKILAKTIRLYSKNDLVEQIQRIELDLAKPIPQEIVESLLEHYGTRDHSRSLEIFANVEGIPNLAIMNLMLNCLIQFDQKSVEAHFAKIATPSIYTLTVMLKFHFVRREVNRVEEILKRVETDKIPMNHVFVNALLDGFSSIGDYERVITEFEKRAVEPDVYVYCTVMNAYFLKQEYEKVFETFYHMIKDRVVPTTPIYHVMLKTHLARDKHTKAHELIQKMKVSRPVEDRTYQILLKYYDSHNLVDEAQSLREEMKSH